VAAIRLLDEKDSVRFSDNLPTPLSLKENLPEAVSLTLHGPLSCPCCVLFHGGVCFPWRGPFRFGGLSV